MLMYRKEKWIALLLGPVCSGVALFRLASLSVRFFALGPVRSDCFRQGRPTRRRIPTRPCRSEGRFSSLLWPFSAQLA